VLYPLHVRSITYNWVYNVRTHSDGSFERYKARLVACGFQQKQDHDYDETFALVTHMSTIHTLLTMASIHEWSISQLNVKNVFLNGELHQDVYMRPPPVYSVPQGMVCHLHHCDTPGVTVVATVHLQCFYCGCYSTNLIQVGFKFRFELFLGFPF
jgi:hypothetical protein